MTNEPLRQIQTLGPFRSRLDPAFVHFFDEHMAGTLQSHQVSHEEYRSNPARYAVKKPPGSGPSIGREYAIDCPLPGGGGSFPIRIYEPEEMVQGESIPLYFHIHGGGFVGGAAGMDAPWLRRLVKELGILVADIDYRLAPEYPAPTPRDDAWLAFTTIISQASILNFDPSKIIIGGISAGANLATVVALRAVQQKIPLLLQILVVPVTDLDVLRVDFEHDSWKEFADNPILSSERMLWFLDQYLGPRESEQRTKMVQDWTLSPLKGSNFAALPPTMVVTAEIDILRDEGEAYATKLASNGVTVSSKRYPGVPHTFLHFGELVKASKHAQDDIINKLREVLAA